MSTELKSLIGNIELPLDYEQIEVSLSRFYGGSIRGTSLQVSFKNEKGESQHFQLSNENVKLLHQQLEEHFNLK